jgi:hypothetical protein
VPTIGMQGHGLQRATIGHAAGLDAGNLDAGHAGHGGNGLGCGGLLSQGDAGHRPDPAPIGMQGHAAGAWLRRSATRPTC